MTLSSRSARRQPVLDEGSFQQLLGAAYVVQEHNAALPAQGTTGTSQVLSAVAEIQSLIRARSLNLAGSASLVAEKLLALTDADGVSISLVDNGYLDCVAEAGAPAKIPGSCLSSHSLVATERLKAGGIFESSNAQNDFRLDMDLCRSIGVGSLVAAPVLRFAEIAGLIEVRWQKTQGFSEGELRTCRLLAGLMTATLERSIRLGNAREVHTQRWPVEIGLHKSTPGDTAAGNSTAAAGAIDHLEAESVQLPQIETVVPAVLPAVEAATPAENAKAPESVPNCRMCGRPFAGDERFCGFCSMPRPAENPPVQMQGKWASMWFMQRAQGALGEAAAGEREATFALPEEFPSPAAETAVDSAEPDAITRILNAPREEFSSAPTEVAVPESAPVREEYHAEPPVTITIESGARAISFPFDDQPPLSERAAGFAKRHWRDAALTMMALVLAFGLFSAWPKSSGRPTWFESLMTRWGVTHPAGQTPAFAGRADARVWIDVHTELYYCQGEDLYGKTPDGDFTTQHNAQSDGFLPASNTLCP